MGVNARIRLPARARLRDVTKAIGLAAGLPPRMGALRGGGAFLEVDGVKAEAISNMPECAGIEWSGAPIKESGWVMYHFEGEGGTRLMLPPSTPFWVAVARKLVDAFGGTVDYNDCDDVDVDYKRRSPACLSAEEGRPWDQWQRRLAAVAPVTGEDIEECRPLSAYRDHEDEAVGA